MDCLKLAIAALGLLLLSAVGAAQQDAAAQEAVWQPEIPEPLIGPYIADPATLAALDHSGAHCDGAGRLNFQCLVYRDDRSGMKRVNLDSNPFSIPVFEEVRKTVAKDLKSIDEDHPEYGGADAPRIDDGFLNFAGAYIELVGVVNRMDRQFNRDPVPGHGVSLACGEISAIYRFGYAGEISGSVVGADHYRSRLRYRSRLPITMNVVFPAIPWSRKLTCADIAKRWLSYVEAVRNGAPPEQLLDQAKLLVSSLRPEDVDRIELNMQGSRVPASADETDFGTLATYIIRVFRWEPQTKGGRWMPSYLSNQVDRARLLGLPGDDNTCEDRWGKKIDRKELVGYLLSMDAPGKGKNAFGDVDNGLVNIPQEFLACRAISISPGGASRSGNQPFWNARSPAEQLITDTEINEALERYRKLYPDSLSFVGSAEEFRTRLNDASCSGCHQTRAIAGFHFPGADRPGASAVNAVFLPASPHFFGDQLRRMDVLRLIADGIELSFHQLAMSYAARPLNKYTQLKPSSDPTDPDSIQLVGGWGGACLTKPASRGVRQWNCAANLECQALFDSSNQAGIGVCVSPRARPQIGEAMQFGTVTTRRFGHDTYRRTYPTIPPRVAGAPRNTTITVDQLSPPAGNSFFAAHQEYYEGIEDAPRGETPEQRARRVRDQQTGGFPAGALRLTECVGLPSEATCGLLASSGFNDCLAEAGRGKRTPDNCFEIYTSYAGVRACEPSNPCRDDYICMSPMGYTATNATALFSTRAERRQAARASIYETDINKERLGIGIFGERMPDGAWLSRNDGNGDHRGVCIPPYFVFQFKADGHRVPAAP